ncbi:hypothetical protein [Palleronia abyssalis]|nr:hypothetical protein [Palleronia abyssalis]
MDATSAGTQKVTNGEVFMKISNANHKSVVSSLGKTETVSKKIIDTNSMMNVFDDDIRKATEGDCGVSINFDATPLSPKLLANATKRKFFANIVHEAEAAVRES